MSEGSVEIAGRPRTGQVLQGLYRVTEALGAGGMGALYLADNISLPGQQVAVKVMQAADAEAKAMLRREAQQLVAIRHPTVVQALAFGEEPDFQYLVLEYLDGQTLEEVARQLAPLEPMVVARIGARLAEALHAIHEAGLVHRDLKPANVMLKLAKDRARFVDWLKLIDFGLSLDRGEQAAQAMGTPEYVAPEQVENAPTSAATDVYSLGVILFELLVGHPPHQHDDVRELLRLRVSAEVPSVRDAMPDVDAGLDALVRRMMARAPAQRPDAAEVARQLNAIDARLASDRTGLKRLSQLLPRPAAGDSKDAPTLRIERVAKTDPAALDVPPRRRWAWVVVALVLVGLGAFALRARGPVRTPGAGTTTGPTEREPLGAALDSAAVEPPVPSGTEKGLAAVEPLGVATGSTTLEPGPAADGAAVTPEKPRALPPAPSTSSPKPQAVAAQPSAGDPKGAVAAKAPGPVASPSQSALTASAAPPEPACVFDDRFRDYARRTRQELRELGDPSSPAFKRHEDALGSALVARDCREAQTALNALRRLVGAPID